MSQQIRPRKKVLCLLKPKSYSNLNHHTVKCDDTDKRQGKGKRFSLKSTSLQHNAKRAVCLQDDPGTPASVEAAGALAGAGTAPYPAAHPVQGQG